MKTALNPVQNKWLKLLSWICWLILVIFSIYLCTLSNPFRENLTGLGWIDHHMSIMIAFSLMATLFNCFLMVVTLMQFHEKKRAILILFFWILCFLSACIPYYPYALNPWQSALKSLHLFLCWIGISGILSVWFSFLFLPWKPGSLKSIAFVLLIIAAISICFSAISGSISLLSELLFLALAPLPFLLFIHDGKSNH